MTTLPRYLFFVHFKIYCSKFELSNLLPKFSFFFSLARLFFGFFKTKFECFEIDGSLLILFVSKSVGWFIQTATV